MSDIDIGLLGNIVADIPISSTPSVERKTPSVTPDKKKIPEVILSKTKNPLNKFRSYNYLFTLACVRKNALSDPDTLRKSADYCVIAKSAGKGNTGISGDQFNNSVINSLVPKTVSQGGGRGSDEFGARDPRRQDLSVEQKNSGGTNNGQQLLADFNTNSPGRFDFFINDVNIETLMGGGPQTNVTIATSIKFDIFEPYSINGFLQALQVAAIAAGHTSYASAPFLLKMEFIGYPDSDKGASDTIVTLGKEATRYFVFSFTKMDIESSESGTKYKCDAVPYNERVFGDPNILKTNAKITGKTVGEILTNFADQINKAKKEESKNIRGADKAVKCDNYAIEFSNPNSIADKNVTDLLTTNNNFQFADPSAQNSKEKSLKYESGKTTVHFSENQQIHDCIAAIIRDSDYTKALLKEMNKAQSTAIDANGLVDYFLINVESVMQNEWDEYTNRQLFNYKYIVTPYKIHYTRIPLYESKTTDSAKLKLLARREYNYIYTGKNIDVRKFNLKFDHLYFQAIPNSMGNNAIFSSASGYQPTAENTVNLSPTDQAVIATRNGLTPPILSDPRQNNLTTAYGSGNRRNYSDAYDAMAKNMHQAILDNTGMISAEITILGDPFYLVTGGMGNYKPVVSTYGETEDNEASYQTGDVFIIVNFRNPIDINKTTGLLDFDAGLVPFSGAFRVLSIASTFKDGEFEQRLSLLRIPGQYNNQTSDPDTSVIDTSIDPSSVPIDSSTVEQITTRISSSDLTSLASGNILSGVSSTLNQVSGAIAAGVSDVSNILNQVSSTVNSGISTLNKVSEVFGGSLAGLNNLNSDIRLAAAGLSNISQLAVGSSAAISQLTNSTVGNISLSAVNQLAVGSAEVTNQINNIRNIPSSVISTFENKISPLAALIPPKS